MAEGHSRVASEPIYDPPGPVNEAFASYYVRHLVQLAIDRAFKISAPSSLSPAALAAQDTHHANAD